MSRRSLDRVEVHWSDGLTEYLVGDDAQRWRRWIEQALALAIARGYEAPDVSWTQAQVGGTTADITPWSALSAPPADRVDTDDLVVPRRDTEEDFAP